MLIQEERQDKECTGNVSQFAVVHSGDEYALERNEDHEAVTKYVVVECAEELREEERGETALTE
jgi:hypothetical protein